MDDRCSQCLGVIEEEHLGYETSRGESLCAPCYFALWGSREGTRRNESEARRPEARRPMRGRPIWIPGPSGELDPEFRVRRHRWWRR